MALIAQNMKLSLPRDLWLWYCAWLWLWRWYSSWGYLIMILILQRRKISMYRTGPTHEVVLHFEFRVNFVMLLCLMYRCYKKTLLALPFLSRNVSQYFPALSKHFLALFFPQCGITGISIGFKLNYGQTPSAYRHV